VLALALAGCSEVKSGDKADAALRGEPVLRVLYRDSTALMLLTLPARPGGKAPPRDCAVPLLIDPVSGAARAMAADEVTARLRSMQLAGATPGACSETPGSPD
jgi:hypothetical protein